MDKDNNAYRLMDNLLMINRAVDDGMYSANRYHVNGADHHREDILETFEEINELTEEILEREKDG